MDAIKAIQIAVAKADIIISTIAENIPRLLIAVAVGLIAGKVVLECLPRK